MLFKKQKSEPVNLLDLHPSHKVRWEVNEENLVVLLIPKFNKGFLAKWLMPRLKHPNIRIKLDTFGSFVWKHFDGSTPISIIGEKMKSEFGESVEPVFKRIGIFLQKLEKEKFITINK